MIEKTAGLPQMHENGAELDMSLWTKPERQPPVMEDDGFRRIKLAPIPGATRQLAESVGFEVVDCEEEFIKNHMELKAHMVCR